LSKRAAADPNAAIRRSVAGNAERLISHVIAGQRDRVFLVY
jgi:hypothetical protein